MEAPTRPSLGPALEIVETLRRRGHRALLVGGWVRDVKGLGLSREQDVDIATSATPEQVRGIFPRTVGVGQKFGVVLVLRDDLSFEVATFRRDVGSADGRRPQEVVYTLDPAEDAQRRDFTVNGLYYDPETDQILDFVNGQADLSARVIRAIGPAEARFEEDYLRMLRAARFAKQLDFAIEASTARAVKALAGKIGMISTERIREELIKLLSPPGGGRGLSLLKDLDLLPEILPEVSAMAGVPQPEAFHPEGDVFEHTCLCLDALDAARPALVMAALLHDTGKPGTLTRTDRIRFNGHAGEGARITEAVMDRLRFSKVDIQNAVDLVARHMDFMHVEEMRPGKLKRFLRLPNFPDHLSLHRADCLASHGNLGHISFVKERLAELREEELRPPPLITGEDLIETGLSPGPIFRRILDAVEEGQLNGELTTKTQALALARRLSREEAL